MDVLFGREASLLRGVFDVKLEAEITFAHAWLFIGSERRGGGCFGAHSSGQTALISSRRLFTCSRREAEAMRV